MFRHLDFYNKKEIKVCLSIAKMGIIDDDYEFF